MFASNVIGLSSWYIDREDRDLDSLHLKSSQVESQSPNMIEKMRIKLSPEYINVENPNRKQNTQNFKCH